MTPSRSCRSPADVISRLIDRLVERAGFAIERLATSYIYGPKLMTFMYEGSARPK